MNKFISDYVPSDHSRQVNARFYIDKVMSDFDGKARVLDLGCGHGNSFEHFKKGNSEIEWIGLDIDSSPEVRSRPDQIDKEFHTYNGTDIPFSDGSFDIVYSCQAFEHIRFPERVLAETSRVLKRGGIFFGSVSSLEPYHSFSFWSFTPYGWVTLLKDADLVPLEIRPGIDGRALIERQYLGSTAITNSWFHQSPLNAEIENMLTATEGASVKRRNLEKLRYCGHLVFISKKV